MQVSSFMMTTTCPTTKLTSAHASATYPVLTVIVFKGEPSSAHLVEAYRLHWDNTPEGAKAARRTARRLTTASRLDWQTGKPYIVPAVSIFEDSPSRGLGAHVAEYDSRARKAYLARVAATGRA